MNNANLRQSLRLKEKYKRDLGLVRDILEEILDSLDLPSKSQLTFEETSSSQHSSSSKPNPNTPKMVDREEVMIDNDEWQDRRDRRVNASTMVGRRELPIFNGREDPTRFLARYSSTCQTNNEGAPDDLVRIFPLALTGTSTNWFLDMDVPERLSWEFLSNAFIKRIGTNKLLDSPICKLNTIKMTWFISRLARGIRREMKMTTTYASLTTT